MDAIWNSLCRQRRMVKLLVLVVAVTVWHRSHARERFPVFVALSRLIPHQNDSSSICVDVVWEGENDTIEPPPLIVRGGYRDEADRIAAEAPVLRQHFSKRTDTTDEYVFSLFQPGDGHETDVDGIPLRYLNMHNGKRDLSLTSLESTLSWRTEHSIDRLLRNPHEQYDIAKAVFPHYFAGRDREDHVVFVQRPGMLSMELADVNGLSKEALLRHYVFVNEYLWQVVEADRPMAVMLGIIDLQGINLKTLRQGDIISFLKQFVKTMDSHYPQRAHKTLLINTPKWFHLIYKLVSPLLRESTKEKIEILSRGKKQDAVLNHRLEDATRVLPESFFSSYNKKKKRRRKQQQQADDDEASDDDEVAPDASTRVESQLELELREFVLARLKEAGTDMAPVVSA